MVRLSTEATNGVLEPTVSKIKSLKSALEACVSILRIDTIIEVHPESSKRRSSCSLKLVVYSMCMVFNRCEFFCNS